MATKITIIGPQKLGSNLAKGLINSGIEPSNITVVGRANTDYSRVEKLNVNITKKLSNALDADVVFFAVQPKHVAGLAHDLKQARIEIRERNERFPNPKFISLVSGLSPNRAVELLGVPHNSIVCATTDTNVATGKGVIPYVCSKEGNHLRSTELLGLLGEVRKELKFKEVIKGVTLYGATKALDVKALKLIFLQKSRVSVYDYVSTLSKQFENLAVGKTGFLGWTTGQETDQIIKPYLMNKARVIQKVFNVEAHDAILISVKTFVNTVNVLANEAQVSTKTFDEHIKDVVTEGGCTERGLSEVVEVNDLTSDVKLTKFFTKVHNRTKRFKFDIKNSFENFVPVD